MSIIDPHQYIRDADLLYDEKEVVQAIKAIALRLNADYKDERPVILSVMTGAVYFTGQLMSYLSFPFELDYVHATRYQDGIEGKEINWRIQPPAKINSKNVLIIDDILDEGVTLNAIKDACYAAGATQVCTAVLVEKKISKTKPIAADYVGLTVPNRFVFGCGMDIYGWWRNRSAIYALKDT